MIPPVWLDGELSYSILQRETERDKGEFNDTALDKRLTFRLNAHTYIWQPWFGLLDAGLVLGQQDGERTFNSANGLQLTNQDDNTDAVNGHIKLRIFPRSHFPFEAFYQHSDTRTESLTDQGGDSFIGPLLLLNDFTTTRYGATQFYTSARGIRMTGRAEKIEADDGEDIDIGKFLQLTAAGSYNEHKLDSNLFYDQFERNSKNENSEILSAELLHRYTPRERNNLNLRNDLTYEDRTTDRIRSLTNQQSLLQFNNYTNWTLDTARPTRISANAQVQRAQANSDENEITFDNLNANLGVVHSLSPVMQVTGALGGNASNRSGDERERSEGSSHRSFESLGARYFPYAISLGRFRYNWSTSGAVRLEQDTDGDSTTLSAGLGHNLNRHFQLGRRKSLTLSANQALNPLRRNGVNLEDDRYVMLLNQQVALRFNRTQGKSNIYTSLTLSDSRDFGDDDNSFQSLNLQFSGSWSINRDSSFGGSATWQIAENESGFDDELRDTTQSNNKNLSASLEYRHRRAFKINRMRFRSKLVITDRKLEYGDNNIDRLLTDQRIVHKSWENRLEYRIGLLDLKLIGRLSEFDDDSQASVLFQISRYFAGAI